jgi:predicted  nucleic acid-binding Zn-ribbon protein
MTASNSSAVSAIASAFEAADAAQAESRRLKLEILRLRSEVDCAERQAASAERFGKTMERARNRLRVEVNKWKQRALIAEDEARQLRWSE